MIEKRTHPRFIVEGMDIHARTILNTEAEILDISATGVSVRCPKRLNIDGLYTFKFKHGNSELAVKGIVVWEKLTGSRQEGGEGLPVYTAGIEFRDVLTGKARQLMVIIADRIRERRLSGVRIRIHGMEKVVLTHLETCEVNDVSIGGMRVQMGHEVSDGTVFRLELILPGDESSVYCRGRVAFCNLVSAGPPEQYAAGVEFLEMSAADKMILQLFIDTLMPLLNTER